MKTKEWKGAIKHSKQKIAHLKRENQIFKDKIFALKHSVVKQIKWWQFWK